MSNKEIAHAAPLQIYIELPVYIQKSPLLITIPHFKLSENDMMNNPYDDPYVGYIRNMIKKDIEAQLLLKLKNTNTVTLIDTPKCGDIIQNEIRISPGQIHIQSYDSNYHLAMLLKSHKMQKEHVSSYYVFQQKYTENFSYPSSILTAYPEKRLIETNMSDDILSDLTLLEHAISAAAVRISNDMYAKTVFTKTPSSWTDKLKKIFKTK